MAKYRHPANPERNKAMIGLRSSNAAQPMDNRPKRLRTRQSVKRNAIKES